MTEAFTEAWPNIVSLNLVQELDEDVAQELGLLIPGEDLDQLELSKCLKHQELVAERLQQHVAEHWLDFRTEFILVCGTGVYASRQPLLRFDQPAFDQGQPYYSVLLPRPRTAYNVHPTARVRWLRAVPDLQ